jgi:hypothetical protein
VEQMVGDIKKSDIQALLTAYHTGDGDKTMQKGFLRNSRGSLPDFIIALEAFVKELDQPSPSVDTLAPKALFELLKLLLSREVRTHTIFSKLPKRSEKLARKLEEKFDVAEFQELKNCFNLNTLDFDKFMTICKLARVNLQENSESLPYHLLPDHLLLDPIVRTQSPELMQEPLSQSTIEDKNEIQPDQVGSQQSDADNINTILTVSAERSLSGKISLSQSSRHYHGLFFNQIEALLPLLRQLLSHGALGELEQAEAIWRKHPDLLECYGTVYHPNRIYIDGQAPVDIPFQHNPGRYKYIHLTYLQMLWMNKEYEEAIPIEKMLGPKEVARQFFEVFPDGAIKKYDFDLKRALALLNTAFEAIMKDKTIVSDNFDQMNTETRNALDALYFYAKPESDHQIGLVFDPHFYLAALELYDKQAYGRFGENWSKYDFWCIRVNEWLAGCLGTGYLRPHAQGIGNNAAHRRGCLLADESSYFSFRRTGSSIMGLDFFVGYYGGVEAGARANARRSRLVAFQTLCRAKNISAIDLCNRATQTLKQYPDL